jgi:hypothetical protein
VSEEDTAERPGEVAGGERAEATSGSREEKKTLLNTTAEAVA